MTLLKQFTTASPLVRKSADTLRAEAAMERLYREAEIEALYLKSLADYQYELEVEAYSQEEYFDEHFGREDTGCDTPYLGNVSLGTAEVSYEPQILSEANDSPPQKSVVDQIELEFRKYVQKHSCFPSRRILQKICRRKTNVVNAVCTRLRSSEEFTIYRLQNLRAESLLNSRGSICKGGRGKGVLPLDHTFNPLQEQVDLATRKLKKLADSSDNDLSLFMLGITPQDLPQYRQHRQGKGQEESAYLALCHYSNLLVDELLAGISTHTGMSDFPVVWVFEIQPTFDRLLHWHSFALLPKNSLTASIFGNIAQNALEKVHTASKKSGLTPNLPDSFSQDFKPFLKDQSSDSPSERAFIHIPRDREEPTYLAKIIDSRGHSHKEPRVLRLLNGQALSPRTWAGWSPELIPHLPVHSS